MNVLFICMGNIYRSPFAAAVLNRYEGFHADSAGTENYHVGKASPEDALVAARSLSIDMSAHRARQVSIRDIQLADCVLYMDDRNLTRLEELIPSKILAGKVQCLASYVGMAFIKDPYKGGPDQLREVYDDIARSVEAFAVRQQSTG